MELSQQNSTQDFPEQILDHYQQIKNEKQGLIKKKVKKAYRQFTKEEDQLLLLQVFRHGKRFEAIAKTFPKRSKHELKNRYYTHLKYKENEIFNTNYYSLSNVSEKSIQRTYNVSQNDLIHQVNMMEIDQSAKFLMENLIVNIDGFFSNLKRSFQN